MFFCRSGFFCIFAGETLTAFCSGAPARRSHLCDLRHIQKSAETIRNNNFPYRPPRLSSRVCIPHCTAAPICSLHTGTGEAAPAVKIRKPSHRSPVVSDCLYVRRPSAIGPAHKNRRDKHLRPLPRQNSCHSRPKPHRCLPAPHCKMNIVIEQAHAGIVSFRPVAVPLVKQPAQKSPYSFGVNEYTARPRCSSKGSRHGINCR